MATNYIPVAQAENGVEFISMPEEAVLLVPAIRLEEFYLGHGVESIKPLHVPYHRPLRKADDDTFKVQAKDVYWFAKISGQPLRLVNEAMWKHGSIDYPAKLRVDVICDELEKQEKDNIFIQAWKENDKKGGSK